MKERITVLLGAGAMIEATGISTKSLTEKTILQCKKYKINTASANSVVDVICDKFLSIYKQEILLLPKELTKMEQITSIISFEDIFHVLELLPNYKNMCGYKGHTSAFQIFSELNDEFRELDMISVYGSAREIIDLINEEVYQYDSQFASKGQLFKKFFEEISSIKNYAFDVFNLNYDTWVEQSLINYNDGYVDVPGYENKMQRFDIGEYLKENDMHTISHLHGQICFEYPEFKREDINNYAFQESHNTLYKYIHFDIAKDYRQRYSHSSDHTQSGENLFRTNILTGLMKTDKLLWNPLNVYHNKLMNSLIKSKKLIIIGYGFSDLYINYLLYQYNALHFMDRKMLMIDYVNGNQWHPQIEHPFKPNEKALFTNIMCKDDFWCRRNPFKPQEDVIISSDNMICICTAGFNSVCNNYMMQIKQFLN